MWVKKLSVILLVAISVFLAGCNQASTGQTSLSSLSSKNLSKVQSWFIQENQIMTERDALSKEISYYRPPQIVRSEQIGWLSGKNLIHIANAIEKEDNEKPMTSFMGSSPMKYVRNVQDIKEYGLNHPDEYSAELYVFAADFVHFNRGISRVWKLIAYIPEMDRYIDIDGNHIAGQPINGFVLEGHEWVSKLPIYEDLPL